MHPHPSIHPLCAITPLPGLWRLKNALELLRKSMQENTLSKTRPKQSNKGTEYRRSCQQTKQNKTKTAALRQWRIFFQTNEFRSSFPSLPLSSHDTTCTFHSILFSAFCFFGKQNHNLENSLRASPVSASVWTPSFFQNSKRSRDSREKTTSLRTFRRTAGSLSIGTSMGSIPAQSGKQRGTTTTQQQQQQQKRVLRVEATAAAAIRLPEYQNLVNSGASVSETISFSTSLAIPAQVGCVQNQLMPCNNRPCWPSVAMVQYNTVSGSLDMLRSLAHTKTTFFDLSCAKVY